MFCCFFRTASFVFHRLFLLFVLQEFSANYTIGPVQIMRPYYQLYSVNNIRYDCMFKLLYLGRQLLVVDKEDSLKLVRGGAVLVVKRLIE